MAKDHLARKLAVILHADVVSSTALVQKNEVIAHERIQAAFRQFSETIGRYGGKAREIRALPTRIGRSRCRTSPATLVCVTSLRAVCVNPAIVLALPPSLSNVMKMLQIGEGCVI
jgi:hypothetical protein